MTSHISGHSFANMDSDKYSEFAGPLTKLFEPISEIMREEAYDNWRTIVNEHVVRAVSIRLMDIYMGKEMAEERIKREKRLQFIYIEPLVEKLKEFEKLRDDKGITFTEFYPELIAVFK